VTTLRDIFTDLFANERPDPVAAARRAMQPPLPRRFYQKAGVEEAEGGYRVVLDDRTVRTPARGFLIVPSLRLAHAIAAEWDAQGESINPVTMPLTRLANSIIDGVAAAPGPVAADVQKYLGSDLLFYRAEGPQRLIERQARLWDPVCAWAQEALGARFVLAQGVVHAAQPEGAIAAARAAIPADPWRLGAVHVITTLTGSALLALALLRGHLTTDEAWTAAHVDEDWNMEQWGRDEIALARRAARRAELEAAATVLAAL
jgi:chaperone required for assembly of F1-ATPase